MLSGNHGQIGTQAISGNMYMGQEIYILIMPICMNGFIVRVKQKSLSICPGLYVQDRYNHQIEQKR